MRNYRKIHPQLDRRLRLIVFLFGLEYISFLFVMAPEIFLLPIFDPVQPIYDWWYRWIAVDPSGAIRFGTADRPLIYIFPYAALLGTFVSMCLLLFIVTASAIDFRRRRSMGPISRMHNDDRDRILANYPDDWAVSFLVANGRVEVLRSDKSIGACVVGVLKQKVVISSGLLVLLRKGSSIPRQIISHEYAHILNFDKLLIGVAALSIPLMFYFWVIDPAMNGQRIAEENGTALFGIIFTTKLLRFFLTYRFLWWIAQRRENFADLIGSILSGSKEEYIRMLQSGSDGNIEFFHPSIENRVRFLRDFPKSLETGRSMLITGTAIVIGLGMALGGLAAFSPPQFAPVFDGQAIQILNLAANDATLLIVLGLSLIGVGVLNFSLALLLRTLAHFTNGEGGHP